MSFLKHFHATHKIIVKNDENSSKEHSFLQSLNKKYGVSDKLYENGYN